MRGPFEETELLAKYVTLAQLLQRLPTSRDLQLKHRQSADFPDHKVFDRFGNKRALVERLRDYCNGRSEFGDVVQKCDEYLRRADAEVPDKDLLDEQLGYVYLIKHGSRREYKIGCTINPLRREGEIAIELPERVKPVHVIATDDAIGIEAYWHKRFADKRKNGEWFDLSPSDVKAFKRRRFM